MPSSNSSIWRYVRKKLSEPSLPGERSIDPSHFGGVGIPGLGGAVGSGLAPYIHIQSTMSTAWVINHDLGRIGSITTYLENGAQVEGTVVSNGSRTSTVVFATALTGTAYCI